MPQHPRDVPQILSQGANHHLHEEREGYAVGPESEHLGGGAFDDGGVHFTIRPPPHGVEFSNGGMMNGGIHAGAEMAEVDSKNAPARVLALPEDRISLSETLCIVREVRHLKTFYSTWILDFLKSNCVFFA
jgi:hypothetical protein